MKYPATTEKARISEIFSSLQGEGPRMGERHIFVRFAECHIHCNYCDELGKPSRDRTLEETVSEVLSLEGSGGPHSFVSFTGGEPLLYVAFLKPLMESLKEKGLRVYLETDGILEPALRRVIDLCDCIAMDMKPASVTGEKNFFSEHEAFLKTALEKETFVKIVLSREIAIPEFEALVDIVARIDAGVPVILQPVSGEREGHEDPELMALLVRLQRLASARLEEVRIVPRLHRILGIL